MNISSVGETLVERLLRLLEGVAFTAYLAVDRSAATESSQVGRGAAERSPSPGRACEVQESAKRGAAARNSHLADDRLR
jgi:hypothetical protein